MVFDKQKQAMLAEAAEQKRMSTIIAAERAFAFDMSLLAALGGSALEGFANLGQANSDILDAELPKIYTDFSELREPLIPRDALLGSLKVTIEHIPYVGHDLTFIELGLNSIHSSNVTAFAFDVKEHPRLKGVSAGRMYIRYKGGGLYRYLPQTLSRMIDMVKIAKAMSQQMPTTLTIGEYVERVIKASHEAKKATCEVFDPATNMWGLVLSKAQKAEIKETGEKDRVWAEAQDYNTLVHVELVDAREIDEGTQTSEEGAQVSEQAIGAIEANEGEASDDPTPTEEQNSGTEIETPQVEELPTPDVVPEPTSELAPQVLATLDTEAIGEEAEF
jgi:hypothetical protein